MINKLKIGKKFVRIEFNNPILKKWINDFYLESGCVNLVDELQIEPSYYISFLKNNNLNLSLPVGTEKIVLCNTEDDKYRLSGIKWEKEQFTYLVIDELKMKIIYNKNTRKMDIIYRELFYLERVSGYNITKLFDVIMQPLFYRLFERQYGCLFHSACVEYNQYGIIWMGETLSGKTTGLLSLVLRYNAKVIAWGRAIGILDDDTVLCHGFPSYENIRLLTLEEFGLSCENAQNPVDYSDDKSRVTFIAKTNPCNIERVQNVPCKFVFGMKYDGTISETVMKEMEKKDSIKMLNASCLTPYDDVYVDWLPFAQEEDIKKAKINQKDVVEKLSSLRCIEVRHNGDVENLSETIINYIESI